MANTFHGASEGQQTLIGGAPDGQRVPIDGALEGQRGAVGDALEGQRVTIGDAPGGQQGPIDGALQGRRATVDDAPERQQGVIDGAPEKQQGPVDPAPEVPQGPIDHAPDGQQGPVDHVPDGQQGPVDHATDGQQGPIDHVPEGQQVHVGAALGGPQGPIGAAPEGQQGPIEPDIPFDDEGYAESSTSSFVSSIASEIRNGTVENGRVYAAYGNHEYGLPVDDDELDRLDMNHQKYTLLQGNRLFLAPITPTPQKILDLGTGTGIFAIDVADMYPSASVIGTDIAPVQPQWVPPNCQFEIEDAEDDWTFQKNDFDYIHGRDFYHSIRDWRRLVQQSYDHLKPGGYLELACVWPVPGCDDKTLPEDCAYVEVCRTFQEIGAKIKADPDAPLHFHEYLRESGFANVSQTVLKIPTSPWPKDPRLKKVGALELMNLMEGAQGFLLRGYTKEFGKTREELEVLLMQMRKELTTQKYHSYVSFYVVYGQKPQGSTQSAENM